MADTTTRKEWRDALAAPRSSRWNGRGSLREALSSKRLLFIAALILATALVYGPSSAALGALWSDSQSGSYSHGFLILVTSVWLLVRDRERIDAADLKPEPLVLPALLVASTAWLFFWRAAIQDLHLLLLPVLALLAIAAAFGRPIARIAALPLLFLDFAMPIWGNIRVPLQHLSSLAVAGLIWLTGLPAFMTGNIIHLPAGSLEIAEGCSGINFLMVGLAMATLYGEVSRDPLRRRFLWLALMAALALIANWVRIYLIAVIAYRSDMRSPLVANHYWFGWALFAVAFAGFLWFSGRYSRKNPPDHEHARSDRGKITPPQATKAFGSNAAARTTSLSSVATALLCLTCLPLLVYGKDMLRTVAKPTVAIAWPKLSGGWSNETLDSSAGDHVSAPPFSDWSPEFTGATATSRRTYADASGERVEIFVVAYRTQEQRAKLVGYNESLLGQSNSDNEGDGSDLVLTKEQIVESIAGQWREMTVRDAVGAESLIWSRYDIGRRSFVRPRLSQLWYGVAALAGEPVSSLIALRSRCVPTCDVARRRLAEVSRLLPSVRAAAVQSHKEGA